MKDRANAMNAACYEVVPFAKGTEMVRDRCANKSHIRYEVVPFAKGTEMTTPR